jgi:hypothetical protein
MKTLTLTLNGFLFLDKNPKRNIDLLFEKPFIIKFKPFHP